MAAKPSNEPGIPVSSKFGKLAGPEVHPVRHLRDTI